MQIKIWELRLFQAITSNMIVAGANETLYSYPLCIVGLCRRQRRGCSSWQLKRLYENWEQNHNIYCCIFGIVTFNMQRYFSIWFSGVWLHSWLSQQSSNFSAKQQLLWIYLSTFWLIWQSQVGCVLHRRKMFLKRTCWVQGVCSRMFDNCGAKGMHAYFDKLMSSSTD